ncbi:ATP-binding protein [Falsiroseomonas sp.]|uniref:ATP-binding protein n=1 Tax=Falsiroseomonas sp. TaxID=2870721 RepID=UPI002734D948|nr:ATP-binding protein [Falsiroseomonas sp.]MDP3417406.1 ATP-binding protein [Falsiroseomonas sp.]
MLTALILAVLLPLLGFGTFATIRAVEGQRAIAEDRLSDTARALALAAQREFETTAVALQSFATSPIFRSAPTLGDPADVLSQAAVIAGLIGVTVNILRPDGVIEITTARQPLSLQRQYNCHDPVAQFTTTGEASIGSLLHSASTNRWVIPVDVPIRDTDGGVVLILGGLVDTERLRSLLAAWDLNLSTFAALTDACHVVVARSDAAHNDLIGRPVPPDNRRQSEGRIAGLYRAVTLDGTERVVGFHAIPALPGWQVVVAQDAAIFDAAWREPLTTLLLGAALALALSTALASVAAGAILQPARRLAMQAHSLASGPARQPLQMSEPSWIAEFADLETGLREAVVTADARRRAEAEAAQLALSLTERTRALADAGATLQAETARRRAAQAQLTQLQKLEALGQMTGSVVHDFTNVLAAITACFRLIERRAGPNAPVQEIVRQGDRAALRAAALVRQLLAFARHEGIRPEVVDLGALLPEAAEMIRHTVGRRLTVSVDAPPEIWPVLTDPQQLEVALLNLAVNARDAMPHGGVLRVSARNLQLAERTAELRPGDYVVVTVRDDGAGMSPEVLARAQEPFFTTKARGEGTGLGLPMVQRFAEQSHGALRIESNPGQGTEVQITLPRAAYIDLSVPRPSRAAKDERSLNPLAHGGASILLVEEDEMVRLLTAAFLRDLGYTVLEAPSAEAAEALALTMPSLDLLIASIDLPGADGATLAARMLTDRPELRIIFVGGSTPGPALRGEIVLRRPVAGTDLAAAVLAALDGNKAHRPTPGARLLKRLRTPVLRAAYLAWNAARLPGERLPRLERFNLAPLDLQDHGFLIAVRAGAADELTFHPLTFGAALRARLGQDLVETGSSGEDAVGTMVGAYRRCARTGAPVYESARFDLGDAAPERFERLVLPLSEDGATVSQAVGVVLFGDNSAWRAAGAATATDREEKRSDGTRADGP